MWPLLPSTARAAGCSGRRFSVKSRRFSVSFDARTWCCAADLRPGTIPRLGPGPGTTLIKPLRPYMWPLMPSTARAAGRSGRRFSADSWRISVSFDARAWCCAADQRPGTMPRLGPGPDTTLFEPLRPCMWPLMPSTVRAAGRSGRRFSADSQRFAARFGAHAWCCAADQRPGTIPRLDPGPGTTLVWPPQPVMWPQLPCTARAVGRSGRSFAVSSQRFAARFAARARCSHGRHRYTDNKRSSRPHRP